MDRKYLNVDIISFLQEQMERNTQHYRSDFEIDKEFIERIADSECLMDKRLLWLSRPNGTLCVKEREAFIRDTAAHQSWRYYAEQSSDFIIAFAVEVKEKRAGKIYGNLYELNYREHAAEVKDLSVNLMEFEKTFEDGFIVHVPPMESSYGFYAGLVEEHGSIIDSVAVPGDSYMLDFILTAQERKHNTYKTAQWSSNEKPSLDSIISSAKQKTSAPDLTDLTWITVYKDALGIEDEWDNLTEICVKTSWLKEVLQEEGENDMESWLWEYTADDTDHIARQALSIGAILACDDLNMYLPGENDVQKQSMVEMSR